MSVTLAHLQALKRQTGARPALPTAPTIPVAKHGVGDIHRLRQLLRIRQPRLAQPATRPEEWELPGKEMAPGLRLIEVQLPIESLPATISGAFDRRDDFDPRRVLFFDTETTGLAGGTGTRAFMIGAAHWGDDVLHVRQLLITTLAAEKAMLETFAGWLDPDILLASYNGKSYDAPLLRTRYRLARMPDPTARLEHVDLLYPSRRSYRGVYENCRLATIERQVLKIVREDDLPGSEAPAAWLGYLRGGPVHNLWRVAQHNHQDVVSLSRLMLHFGLPL